MDFESRIDYYNTKKNMTNVYISSNVLPIASLLYSSGKKLIKLVDNVALYRISSFGLFSVSSPGDIAEFTL